MSTYNGWTNHATWRANLEIFDHMTLEDFGYEDVQESYDFDHLEDVLREYAEEVITMSVRDPLAPNIALENALAFLSDVHWLQIAGRLIDDFEDKKEAA
jgi:hypothetical protein